jgi:hypothetical protein
MKDPIKWFEDAVKSKKYQKDIIKKIDSCISESSFNMDKFMEWVTEQLKQDIVGDD